MEGSEKGPANENRDCWTRYGRGMDVETYCGLCDQGEETLKHLFITCTVAEGCWEAAGLTGLLHEVGDHNNDFAAWFFKLLNRSHSSVKHVVLGVLWSLWAERNRRVWQHESRREEWVIKDGKELLDEWRLAQNRERNHVNPERQPRCKEWHTSQRGGCKINIDGAIFEAQRKHGTRAVIRDENGYFKGMCQRLHDGFPQPREVEVVALRDAIHWLGELGLHDVEFKVDC
ncbi:hypothetical protein LINPERPRIM_LOCUS16779 [Linum perenne]